MVDASMELFLPDCSYTIQPNTQQQQQQARNTKRKLITKTERNANTARLKLHNFCEKILQLKCKLLRLSQNEVTEEMLHNCKMCHVILNGNQNVIFSFISGHIIPVHGSGLGFRALKCRGVAYDASVE